MSYEELHIDKMQQAILYFEGKYLRFYNSIGDCIEAKSISTGFDTRRKKFYVAFENGKVVRFSPSNTNKVMIKDTIIKVLLNNGIDLAFEIKNNV